MIKPVFFTPGPSELYFTVPDHLRTALREGIPSISHRSPQFKSLMEETMIGLRELLNLGDHYHMVFTSSATEIWERICQNLISNKSYHLVNGAFSNKFFKTAQRLLPAATSNIITTGMGVNVDDLHPESNSELIALTYNETSTGAKMAREDIRMIREKFPEQIIAIDVVSAAPILDFDIEMVDSLYFSVQKGFGLPAGLGVWVYNDRCLEKHQKITNQKPVAPFRNLQELHNLSQKFQTPETPNVLNIFLLNEVIKDMLRKGMSTIHRETQYKSTLLYHTLENHPDLSPLVTEKKHRSLTTIVSETKNPIAIINKLANYKMIIGTGYGEYKDSHIRIANFPTHSKEQFELLVDVIEKEN